MRAKNSLLVGVIVLGLGQGFGMNAYADLLEQGTTPPTPENNEGYKACQQYTILSQKDLDSKPDMKKQLKSKDCVHCKIQVAQNDGFDPKLLQSLGGCSFAEEVAKQVVSNSEGNTKFLEKLVTCYDKFTKQPADKDCGKLREQQKEVLKLNAELRVPLALARGKSLDSGKMPVKAEKSHVNADLEAFGEFFGFFFPQMGKYDALSLQEVEVAKAQWDKELVRINQEVEKELAERKSASGDPSKPAQNVLLPKDFKTGLIRRKQMEARDRYRAEYMKLFTKFNAPLLVYVSKANPSDTEMTEAIKKMISNSKEQRADALDAMGIDPSTMKATKNKVCEFGLLYGDKGMPVERFLKEKVARKNDLVHYLMPVYKEVINQVLEREVKKNDPNNYCALATGYKSHLESRELRYGLLGIPFYLGGAVAAGIGATTAAVATGGRFILGAGEAATFAGAGIGAVGVAYSYGDLKKVEGETLTRTGASPDEKQTGSIEAINEAKGNVLMNAAFSLAFDVPMAAVSAKAAAKSIASWRLSKAEAAKFHKAIDEGSVKDQEKMFGLLRDYIFSGKKANEADIALLREMQFEMVSRNAVDLNDPVSVKNWANLMREVYSATSSQTKAGFMDAVAEVFRRVDPKSMTVEDRRNLTELLRKFLVYHAANSTKMGAREVPADILADGFVAELGAIKAAGSTAKAQDDAFARVLKTAQLEHQKSGIVIPESIPDQARKNISDNKVYQDHLRMMTKEDQDLAIRAIYVLENQHKVPQRTIASKLEEIAGQCSLRR